MACFYAQPLFCFPKLLIPGCREVLSYANYVVHNHVTLLGPKNDQPDRFDLYERFWNGKNQKKNPWLDFLIYHGAILKRKTFLHTRDWRSWEVNMSVHAGPRTKKSATQALSTELGKTADGQAAFRYARLYTKPNGETAIVDVDQRVPEGWTVRVSNKTTENSATEFISLDDQNHLLARRKFFLANNDFFYHDLAHGIGFRDNPSFYEAMVSTSKDLEVPGAPGKSVFHDDMKRRFEADHIAALNMRYFYVMELSHKFDPKQADKLKTALERTYNSGAVSDPSKFKPAELRHLLSEKFSDQQLQDHLTELTRLYDRHCTLAGGAAIDGNNVASVSFQSTAAGAAIATRLAKWSPFEYVYTRKALIDRIILMQGELVLGLHYPSEVLAGAMLVRNRFSWLAAPKEQEVAAAEFLARIYKEDPSAFSFFKGWQ